MANQKVLSDVFTSIAKEERKDRLECQFIKLNVDLEREAALKSRRVEAALQTSMESNCSSNFFRTQGRKRCSTM